MSRQSAWGPVLKYKSHELRQHQWPGLPIVVGPTAPPIRYRPAPIAGSVAQQSFGATRLASKKFVAMAARLNAWLMQQMAEYPQRDAERKRQMAEHQQPDAERMKQARKEIILQAALGGAVGGAVLMVLTGAMVVLLRVLHVI